MIRWDITGSLLFVCSFVVHINEMNCISTSVIRHEWRENKSVLVDGNPLLTSKRLIEVAWHHHGTAMPHHGNDQQQHRMMHGFHSIGVVYVMGGSTLTHSVQNHPAIVI